MTRVPIINQQLDNIEQAIRELAGEYDFTDWRQIVAAIRAGHADRVPNGTVFTVHHDTYGDLKFVTRARNQHHAVGDATRPTITIQALNLIPSTTAATASLNLQYDRPEAMCRVEEAIPASTVVKFTSTATSQWVAGDWHFTATSEIPVGAMLCLDHDLKTPLDQCSVTVYTTPKDTVATQTLALSSSDGGATVDLGTWGDDMNHLQHISYGSNNEAESNLFFWLNCDGVVSDKWTQQTKYDMLGTWYDGKEGFLGGFQEDFRACLGMCAIPNITNTVFESQDSAYETNTAYTHNGFFFLPSRKEIYGINENENEDDEVQFAYYKDIGTQNADKLMFAENAVSPTSYWIRTPVAGQASGVRICNSSFVGGIAGTSANGSYALAPLAILT